MLVFEAVVNKEDVVPARAALGDGDFMWVSAEQYASMSKGVAEVRTPACLVRCFCFKPKSHDYGKIWRYLFEVLP